MSNFKVGQLSVNDVMEKFDEMLVGSEHGVERQRKPASGAPFQASTAGVKIPAQGSPMAKPAAASPGKAPFEHRHEVAAGEGQALQAEIEQLKIAVEIWKDRCMAAEQALDATVEHYEQLTNREW